MTELCIFIDTADWLCAAASQDQCVCECLPVVLPLSLPHHDCLETVPALYNNWVSTQKSINNTGPLNDFSLITKVLSAKCSNVGCLFNDFALIIKALSARCLCIALCFV